MWQGAQEGGDHTHTHTHTHARMHTCTHAHTHPCGKLLSKCTYCTNGHVIQKLAIIEMSIQNHTCTYTYKVYTLCTHQKLSHLIRCCIVELSKSCGGISPVPLCDRFYRWTQSNPHYLPHSSAQVTGSWYPPLPSPSSPLPSPSPSP